MTKAIIYQTGKDLGTYDSEKNGDLASVMQDDCKLLGYLKDTTGKIESIVFEGDNYVGILVIDSGYGIPTLSIHDKEILNDIKLMTK